MNLDLSTFTAWRLGLCEECETQALVTGPPSGPVQCRDCWLGERPSSEPAPGVDDAQGTLW